MKRNENGRFAAGNSGGPGRPKAKTEEQYLLKLYDVVAIHDWQDVVNKALVQAKTGDHRARQWLANYLIGRPKERGELKLVTEEFVDLSSLTNEETTQLSRLLEKIEGRP